MTLSTTNDKSGVTTHCLIDQKIKGAQNKTWTAEKLVPESTIAQVLRKQRKKASKVNTMKTYFNTAMKLTNEQMIARSKEQNS